MDEPIYDVVQNVTLSVTPTPILIEEKLTTINVSPIKHIFAIMLENRSFDQIYGYRSKKEGKFKVNGIDYDNPRSNESLTDDKKVVVEFPQTPITMFEGEDHCGHNFGCVLHSIGEKRDMSGFISAQQAVSKVKLSADGYYYERDDDPLDGHISPKEVMGYFPEGSLPILDYLADNFAVCDSWHCSVPAGTYPNRVFSLTADTKGEVFNECAEHLHVVYDQPSIFDRLTEAKVPWRSYWNDIPSSLLLHKTKSPEYLTQQRHFSKFKEDVSKDASTPYEPYFTIIDPAFIYEADDGTDDPYKHMIGQRLVANVYDAIRANDELWKSSLILVYYDEGGGFYDHVTPPKCVPPRNEYVTSGGTPIIAGEYKHWTFDTFGIRVPAVLISPYVDAGVDHQLYDHTSLLAYMLRQLDLSYLSNRDTTANDFSQTLLAEPREIPFVSMVELFEKTKSKVSTYPLDGTSRRTITERGGEFLRQLKSNFATAAIEFVTMMSHLTSLSK